MGWRNSPWVIGLVALLLHGVAMARYVQRMRAAPDILMAVGSDRLRFPVYADIKSPLGTDGYDGQFYYAIAHAPFAKHGPEIDFPPGRQLRIVFPLLGYMASLGRADWLVFAMPAVNLLMVGWLTVMAARWTRLHGLSPWYGLTLPLAVNALIPLLRNLTDATAMATVFWLMTAAIRRQPAWWVGVAASAAVFTREQNAALLAVVIGHALWERRWGTAAAVSLAVAAWGAWALWLTHVYGAHPFLPGKGNFGPPFTGLKLAGDIAWTEFKEFSPETRARLFLSGPLFLTIGVAVAIAVAKVRRSRRGLALVAAVALMVGVMECFSDPAMFLLYAALTYFIGMLLAWAAFAVRFRREEMLPLGMATGGALLVIVGGVYIFDDYWAYGRAMFWLPMGLWMLAVQTKRETALMWAAATIYFPVCMAYYH